jgi:hypothetical protein
MTGAPRELLPLEIADGDLGPVVGEIREGREIVRVWPHGDSFHLWRILLEAGVLGAINLEEMARLYELWEPKERLLGFIREMGFELNHVPGPTTVHQMIFVVRHEMDPEGKARGEGVFPLEACVNYALKNGYAPTPQPPGTVIPMPSLVELPDGTIGGRGVAISKRLAEFLTEPHNQMLPREWCNLLLNYAARYAIEVGCGEPLFADLAAEVYLAQARKGPAPDPLGGAA